MPYHIPQELTLDVSHFEHEEQFIESLIKQFGFPNLYSISWLGFQEHLFYDPEARVPFLLKVKGIEDLRRKSPENAEKLETVFRELIIDW